MRSKPEGDESVMAIERVVAQPENDSCPQCGSAEIGISFSRSDISRVAAWECHCSDCRFKWLGKL
jgi:predicted RNA-binding Zn-ribbon protein involved in translation (DUF1610 family)